MAKAGDDMARMTVFHGGYTPIENPKDNDLFYTCSLIDYIARKTKNVRATVVNQLGKKRLAKIYDLADVYHCDNIERVADDFIEEAGITAGNFDNVGDCRYAIPSHWDIGKVYKRLIKMIAEKENIAFLNAAAYAKPSAADQEHMDPENHRLLAEAIYQKVIEIEGILE